jgi:Ca-activated chloride channel family protein
MRSTRVLLLTLIPIALLAQRPQAPIRVSVDLVTVNVAVTDSRGRTVLGLSPDMFQVYEDRVEQKVEYFSTEEVAASIGIIFDVSASMEPVIKEAIQAASDFMNMGTKEDEFFLVTFNNRPHVEVNFTRDVSKIRDKLVFHEASGSTALWDAMYLGVEKVKHGENARKALISITDMGNNHSKYSERDFAELMREQDVQIYYLDTDVARQLDAQKIAASLKSQYLLGYRSTNSQHDGKWRDIRVRVKPIPAMLPLSVKARAGYYAPIN